MARRTKEEAQETRHKLLDAAEYLFQAHGVSHTSLQDIARRAGTTRGAIYWHFRDKADLFNAMMERVTLPMEQAFIPDNPAAQTTGTVAPSTLKLIQAAALNAFRQIMTDPQTRRVLEVATQKVEYVEELQAVRLRHLAVRNGFIKHIEQSMNTAGRETKICLPTSARVAAHGLHALIDGLIQNWLLDPTAFDLLGVGERTMNVYLCGLGFTEALPAPNGKMNPSGV
ncbi:MAG: TetR family transcriptional regulator [Polaromonas sp.]